MADSEHISDSGTNEFMLGEDEAEQRALHWIIEKWGAQGKPCPYCHTNNWEVSGPIAIAAMPQTLRPGRARSSALPVFLVMCKNCGNTVFINALVSSLLPSQSEET